MERLFLLFGIFSMLTLNAQNITLENIWSGKYYAQGLWGINSMNDGEHYTLNENDGIYRYAYSSFINQTDSKKLIVQGNFDDYSFSSDEKFLLVSNNTQPIYR